MATKIINPANARNQVSTEAEEGGCAAAADISGNVIEAGSCCSQCSCTRCVEFCETITLNAPFNPAGINSDSARIAYDPRFLGYTVEPETVQAELPCGGTCPVDVYRIGLTGAIPYIIDVGPVSSECGVPVRLSCTGNVMLDEMIGYICGGDEPELTELDCRNVVPRVRVSVSDCGRSDNANVTVYGTFCFSGLPTCM